MRKKKLWRPLTAITLVLISALTALCLAASSRQHPTAVKLTALLLIASTVWTAIELVLWRHNNLRYIARMNRLLDETMRNVPEHMPMPVAMLDATQQFIWYNDSFQRDVTEGADFFGLPITDAFPTLPKQLAEKGSAEIVAANRNYHVFCSEYERRGGKMQMLCFQDITNFTELRRRYWDSRICVVLVVIDNYEDVMSAAKQSERAAVLAALEQLFDHTLEDTESVFCRLDEDRFLVLVEAQHYVKMERARFPILDEVRKILVGGKNALTLSIGVGRGGASLSQNQTYAEQSLDMALGRGGDQAAVKTKTGYTFYGGVSKGVERKSKTRHRAVAKALRELLETCGNVYIMGHRLSDLDAVGSAIGVAFIAQQYGKQPRIVIDTKATLARTLTERLQTECPDWLITPDTAVAEMQPTDLLIVVDTYSKDILESPAVYQAAQHVMVIDHHRKMVNYLENTTLVFHDPYASSASELVTELMQYLERCEQMPQFCAEALLAGIMLDTKNFVMQTGVQTFEAAAYLRNYGADPVVVKPLFAATMSSYRQRSLLVSAAELHGRSAIAVAREPSPELQVIAAQTADDLLGIAGVDASFVIFPRDGLACISARSLGKMNVQVVMEQLGGGGHQTMAATQVRGCTPTALRIRLIEVLDALEQHVEGDENS